MSTESAPAPAPAAPSTPAISRSLSDAPVGSPSPVEANISITANELRRLMQVESQLAQVQAAQQAAIDAANAAKAKAEIEKGEVEKGLKLATETWQVKLNEMTGKYQALETSLLEEKLDSTLAGAFTGREFAGESPEAKAMVAAQLRAILKPQFESARDSSGQIVVREKASLRPAGDAVKEALASPLYAHFFAATSRGGTGADASRPHADQPPDPLAASAARYRQQTRPEGIQNFGLFGNASK